jgi:hypothetical protein
MDDPLATQALMRSYRFSRRGFLAQHRDEITDLEPFDNC